MSTENPVVVDYASPPQRRSPFAARIAVTLGWAALGCFLFVVIEGFFVAAIDFILRDYRFYGWFEIFVDIFLFVGLNIVSVTAIMLGLRGKLPGTRPFRDR